MRWPEPEKVIRRLLIESGYSETQVGTSTPGDLEGNLPYIRIGMVRGADDSVTDRTLMDVEYFDDTRTKASVGAEDLRETILDFQGKQDSLGYLVDRVRTYARPVWVDYRNPKIQRYVATYQVDTRPV